MFQSLTSEKKPSYLSGAVPKPRSRLLAPPVAFQSNQSKTNASNKKSGCSCGGKCGSCKGKSDNKRANFVGDVGDGVFQLDPDGGAPPAKADAGAPDGGAIPMAGGDCKDICDRAYKDSTLNGGGGGVVCEKGTKCACVFDVSPLKRGQCPDFDKVVLNHENRHLPETDCAAGASLSRLGPKPGVDLKTVECTHRKESIKEIDALIPGATGACKTGMQSIRADLDSWVKANC